MKILELGLKPDGNPKPYKGYKGDSNYCIEIFRNATGFPEALDAKKGSFLWSFLWSSAMSSMSL